LRCGAQVLGCAAQVVGWGTEIVGWRFWMLRCNARLLRQVSNLLRQRRTCRNSRTFSDADGRLNARETALQPNRPATDPAATMRTNGQLGLGLARPSISFQIVMMTLIKVAASPTTTTRRIAGGCLVIR
jgi:hypothetical protein